METTNGNIGNCCTCGGCACQQRQAESSESKQVEPAYCNAQPFPFVGAVVTDAGKDKAETKPKAGIEKQNNTTPNTQQDQSENNDELPIEGTTLTRVPEIELRYIRPARLKAEKHLPSSGSCAELFREIIGIERLLIQEYFIAFFLNRRNRVVGYCISSKGGISGTVVDIRLILLTALKCLASGIILSHNHPSGGILPSEQDSSVTRKCKEAAELFSISVLDHVIVTTNDHYSFSDEGLVGLPEETINGLTTTYDSDTTEGIDESELSGFRAEAQEFLKNDNNNIS